MVAERAKPRWAVCAAALLCPSIAAAQDALRSYGELGGLWHAVQEVRDALASDSSVSLVVRAAELELQLGRVDRAAVLLERLGAAAGDEARVLPARALLAARRGRADEAGALYRAAAQRTADRGQAAVLAARAAAAFDAAGLRAEALEMYAAARAGLPLIAGWIAVREARAAADQAHAFRLLAQAPPAARRMASRVRAGWLLSGGDTTQAIAALTAADDLTAAATLALASGDSGFARRLGYDALADGDTAVVRRAVMLVTTGLAPAAPAEHRSLALAYRRLGSARDAVRFARAAVVRGDSSAAAFRLLGDVLAEDNQRGAAIEAYAQAAELGGRDGATAQYLRARLLIRVGRRTEGHSALLDFAERFPRHESAPVAMYLVAEAHREAQRRAAADSLYELLAAEWPRSEYAGRARFQLARHALERGERAAAAAWYRAEIDENGAEQRAAALELARLELRGGDTAAAHAALRQLAQRDPVGYYGTIARRMLAAEPPPFPPAVPPLPTASVAATLAALDLLDAIGWIEEAAALVDHAVRRAPSAPDELLALGHGLIERGRVQQGVALGWRATSALPLTDGRVLRVIFPWPMRALIETEAAKYGLDPYLLAGLIRQESTFRPAVTSRAGAQGLMQLMPATASGLAHRLGIDWDSGLLTVADANLHLGAAHLAALLRQYQGSEVLALAAYNAGGRPVGQWMSRFDPSDTVAFVEQIPYLETRGYVKSVLRNRDLYRALYPPPSDAAHP